MMCAGSAMMMAAALIICVLSDPAGAAERGALAVLPLKLLDTSGEPTDQRAEHERRLAGMARSLAAELRGERGFASTELVEPGAIAAACPTETSECLMALARARNARFAFVGTLHKSSTLILQLFARIVEVDGGKIVVSRELNFRGDNDEAWERAGEFLVRELRTELKL